MAVRLLVIIVALLLLLSGLWAFIFPHRLDAYAREWPYTSLRGSFVLRILPTRANVWFIRLLGLGCIALAYWLIYMAAAIRDRGLSASVLQFLIIDT